MTVRPSGIVTFLFTDIEGSTQLWQRYPDAMRLAHARHNAILQQSIETHYGYIFQLIGDAYCAAFATALDALAATLDAQRTLHSNFQPLTSNLQVRVRMGLHSGQAEEHNGDYDGYLTLSRVQRLMTAGHGGQILISRATRDQLADQLPDGVTLRDLGEHRLKDLIQPEHIYQIVAADLPSDFPSLRSLAAFAHNLPLQLTSFIGREKEIADVKRLLTPLARSAGGGGRLLTLTGPGGTGKTRLSLQVAADMLDIFDNGAWFVELAPLSDPALVPHAISAALGAREEAGRPLTDTLLDYLRNRCVLLILDNCEHLVEACARWAETALRACAQLSILASSREPLGIAGETIYHVPSLSLPAPHQLAQLEKIRQSEAVRLFSERTLALHPTFTITPVNAPAVVQICRRLDGIPLAIELAAARVKALSVEQIAARLDDRFRLLTGGSRTALPRQQTLRALIDWSYDLLTAQERLLFRRLSVFAGDWTLAEAEQICAGESLAEYEIMDILAHLVDKSLVVIEQANDGAAQYRLLETIREYARAELRETNETVQLRGRHLDFFLDLVEEAEPQLQSAEQTQWLNRFEMEHDNLRAALNWSLECGALAKAMRFGGALWRFWDLRGHLSEGRRWLESALTAAHDTAVAATTRAKVLNGAGWLALRQGDNARARTLIEESLALMRAANDKHGVAFALNLLGGVALQEADYSRAVELYEQSLALRREFGDQLSIAISLLNRGNVAQYLKDYERAGAMFKESLPIFEKLGDKNNLAFALNNLAGVASVQGNAAQAKTFYDKSLSLRRELGDKLRIAESLEASARMASEQKDHTRAVRLCGAADSLREAIGAPMSSAYRARYYEPTIEAARAQLDGASFNTAWAEGCALTMEQAIDYALADGAS